ncbi:MAG: sigma-54 dependent transcriptional regulator [Planctomycetes bacterium]|nr:sigma-54 dependent transcriptional regulator [Planctomycetota bacterium]
MPELKLHVVACDASTQDQIRRRFERDGVSVECTDQLNDAPASFTGHVPDVILLDADGDGEHVLNCLHEIKSEYPEMPVILFAGDADMPLVVDAMRAGAHDFVAKPLDLTRLDIAFKNASQVHRLMQRVNQLQDKYARSGTFQNMVGNSPRMRQIYDAVEHVSRTDVTVFVTGESGTGKELIAQAIHELSERRAHAFVALHCAAVPKEMLENELFGHERGALGGGDARFAGCAEQADGGTLFLDEICEVDPQLQSKMLRFLETKRFQRVGGTDVLRVNARIIASTNRDPMEQIRLGRLREDLYYRLNVVPLEMPPLCERRSDVPLLVTHFLDRFTQKYGKYFYDCSPEAIESLTRYSWPGNVRELENVIERVVVLNNASQVTARMLPANVLQGASAAREGDPSEQAPQGDVILPFDEVEKREIARALRICGWNVARAAERLELGQATLYRKIKKYGIRLLRKTREPAAL